MSEYLTIKGLRGLFGKFRLGPVDLVLDKGDYLVLLGATGCGKSSFLKKIAGIAGKNRGEILLDGKNIGVLPPEKRQIGYVSQGCDLFPHLTVRENLFFGLKYLGLTRQEKAKRLEKFLDLFHLSELSERPVTVISGGESKRTAMARSLITDPAVLLLDEPLGMLDHNGRREMLDILGMIHNELVTTTIHVSHDRHEAWMIAGKCAVMREGRIIQTGSVETLFRHPENYFTADFLGGVNIFKAEFKDNKAVVSWGEAELLEPPLNESGWILLRPEDLEFASPEGAFFRGCISSMTDFGEYLEVMVKSESDDSPLCVHSSGQVISGFKIGDEIGVNWSKESVHPIIRE
jgi:ABC-type Fe3+/spermidine/putrescine transport system ATPase subunit